MTTQTTRSRSDDAFQSSYILAGARGAVEFHLVRKRRPWSGSRHAEPFFEYHSPRPLWDGQVPQPWLCDVTGSPCYAVGTPDHEAAMLSLNHVAGNRDDGIIWRELERRYAEWEAEG